MRYNDAHIPLSQTDLDREKGKPAPESIPGWLLSPNNPCVKHALTRDIPDGKHLAIVLELTLKQSQYATMALREAMKMSTTQAVHMVRADLSDRKRATLQGSDATGEDLKPHIASPEADKADRKRKSATDDSGSVIRNDKKVKIEHAEIPLQ